jgi:DNA-binding NtrC family response regulator
VDLLHRLSVFPIHVPPVRQRSGDIEVLARHFLARVGEAEGQAKQIDAAAVDVLTAYHWPGNVRQIRNVIHRAYIVAEDVITVECLPAEVRAAASPVPPTAADPDAPARFEVGMTVAAAARRLFEATLRERDGDKRAAAEVLGISLRTLYNRLREYGAS